MKIRQVSKFRQVNLDDFEETLLYPNIPTGLYEIREDKLVVLYVTNDKRYLLKDKFIIATEIFTNEELQYVDDKYLNELGLKYKSEKRIVYNINIALGFSFGNDLFVMNWHLAKNPNKMFKTMLIYSYRNKKQQNIKIHLP